MKVIVGDIFSQFSEKCNYGPQKSMLWYVIVLLNHILFQCVYDIQGTNYL